MPEREKRYSSSEFPVIEDAARHLGELVAHASRYMHNCDRQPVDGYTWWTTTHGSGSVVRATEIHRRDRSLTYRCRAMGANAARRLQGRPPTFGNDLEGTILEPSTVGNPARTNFAFLHDPYDLRRTQLDGQYSLDVWQTLSHGRVSHVPPEELVEPTCEAILGLRYPDNLDLSHARISKEQAATEAKETEESITHILTEICGDLSGRHVIADFALKEQGTGTMWRTTVHSHQSDHGKAMQLAMSEAGDTLNPDLNAALVARRSQIRNPVDEITLAVSRTPGSNPSLSAYASLPSNQSGNEPFRTAVTELDPRTLWPFLTFLSSNAASANALSSRLDSTSRREHGVPWPPRTLTLPDDLRPSDIIKRAQLSAAVAQRS